MTTYIIIVVVIVVAGLALLFVPRALMAAKGAKMKGQPAPTPHKASAKRIKSGSKTILYFHTTKCRVCQSQDPVIRKLQKRYPGAIYKIDAAADRTAASAYGVKAVPYFALIEGGTFIDSRTGLQKEETIVQFLTGDAARG